MAGNRDYQAEARLLARAEAIQFRAILLGFDLVDQWMQAVRNPAPLGPGPTYSQETVLELDRHERDWLRSARPTDADWERTHVVPEYGMKGEHHA